ncbi:hypothetical protein PR202_ga19189 [Eleusine coracana subsp. coracana]|uniref:F-box domain-containing protein n=1 Tax=Eleusine coracana subsp. coracana TaxID=191504 RepID=A0AAV5CVF2_ELECO|nr:hypothetical protein PR202_ga19189 [Eleusine coracana subsp. coracana]
MKKKAGDAVEEMREKGEPSALAARKIRKQKRGGARDVTTLPGVCNDVLDNIFAYLPARATMVLSKHHRRMIYNADFRSLHRRCPSCTSHT